jgi:hypothetical protein
MILLLVTVAKYFLTLLVVWSLMSPPQGVNSQLPEGVCVNFTSAPLSQCTSFVNYPVFVPTNLTIELIDALVANKTGFFRLGLTDSECTISAMKYLCAEAFHPCFNLTVAPPPTPPGNFHSLI